MKKLLVLFFTMALVCVPNASASDVPKWLKGWKAKGDLRVRFESTNPDEDGKDRRDRTRFRLRLSASKKITDSLSVDLRFASGSGDPTSTNQSFDNSFSGKDWLIDRAQLNYKTESWKISAGKMKNNFHTSDLVWDSDVNPEGFQQQYTNGNFYANLAQFFVEEESNDDDTTMLGAQLGYKGGDKVKFNISGAMYDYQELGFYGDGDYNFVEAFAEIKGKAGKTPVSAKFAYVKNTTSEIEDNDTGWAVYLGAGAKKPGQWNGSFKLAEVEKYSSYTDLADSDFGYGDKEGGVLGIGYTVSKNMAFGVKYFKTESIVATDKGFKKIQLDCQLKF